MVRRIVAGLVVLSAIFAAGYIPAHAQGISQKVAVCDPAYTGRCIKPAADGSIAVTGGGGGGGSTSVTANAAPPTWVEGSTTNPLSGNLKGELRVVPESAGNAVTISAAGAMKVDGSAAMQPVSGTVTAAQATAANLNATVVGTGTFATQATQSGTWNIANVSGTVSLPTGAATEASLAKLTLAQGSATSGQTGALTYCAVTTGVPTYTTAQSNPTSCTTSGGARVELISGANTINTSQTNSDVMATSATSAQLVVNAVCRIYNGTNYSRCYQISAADGTGLGVLATATAPNSAAASAITPSVSAAVESSRVLKASAGNFYRLVITTGASAGYVMVFNATSAPADGAVTPQMCRPVAATTSVTLSYDLPSRFTTGITSVFSTTGCFTKTASATAMFEGYTQ